ncbi:hypothetical protein GGX14DRAFT_395273 [Mycena pura]|uniref:Uncharacterized protein n=1 Tax=Mycena pura TaxID=153505 RepID=A0AAD6YCJ4_9AGAR|nr:hypothetical protein GGX14DRAFT_395273 [Mycena pura]
MSTVSGLVKRSVGRDSAAPAARALPEVIFGDPVRQRGGKATKPKKRPKRGTGAGDGQEDGNGKQKEVSMSVSWIWVTQVDRGNPAAVNEVVDGARRTVCLAGGRGNTRGQAYALRQAKLKTDLCASFSAKWAELPEVIRKGREENLRTAVGVRSAGSECLQDGGQGLVLSSSSRETAVNDAASGVHNESAVVDGDGESDTDSKCESRGEAGDDTLLFPS